MPDLDSIASLMGLSAVLALLAAEFWSLKYPRRRVWPPKNGSALTKVAVWLLTLCVFGTAFIVGVTDWQSLPIPGWLRWGLGATLIILGNIVVWRGVSRLGMRATSGGADKLITTGLYRYSRNPQYLADIGILAGWTVLSASLMALPIVAGGILVLLIAPFVEEPWLDEVYGDEYRSYCKTTPRFF